MVDLPLSALWVNLSGTSGRWASSFVFVKLIAESMRPSEFPASRGYITMSALLVWMALRSQAPPLYNGMLWSPLWKADNPDAVEGDHYNGNLHCAQGTFVAVARKPRARERS